MKAKEFYEKFINEVKEDKNFISKNKKFTTFNNKSYLEIYRNEEKVFTDLVNKSIIYEIIKSEGLEAQHEYFRIDTVGWLGRHLEIKSEESMNIGLNRHLWDLKIAVEHENSKSDWMDELIKLVHVKCPLKVVISYNYCDQRKEQELKKLKFVAKWMQEIRAFDSNGKEEYLIILGNGRAKNHKSNESYDKFDYRGYLYNYEEKEFIKLRIMQSKNIKSRGGI